ncbi:MAG: RluA family pseudouridine synthase [Candidatus Kapabacteria bacterium]|nr:RluA family pseudouridine synthase [Candidatus Kapabacteria bacterium]
MKRSLVPVLYKDEHLVVVNKPAGMLAVPDRYDENLPNIKSVVRAEYGSAFTVHRLDKGTSGVMIMALTAEAHKALNEQFEKHVVTKTYLALVSGIVDKDEIKIDIPLASDTRRKGLMKPSAKGKEAHTVVRVLERFRLATLIECDLITGRQHQIRVHCSAIGHPLLVDPDYGKNGQFLLSTIKRRYNIAKGADERPVIDRLTLHASRITFVHPESGEYMTVTAEPPKDFAAAIQILRKYAAPYASAFDAEFF